MLAPEMDTHAIGRTLRWALAIAIAILVVMPSLVVSADTKSYFPPGALDPSHENTDSFINGWYSNHLRAMSEPILKPADRTRTYRFTWLRTFHHPVAVRIVSESNRATLFATELDGHGGYDPGKVLRRKTIGLTPDQFKALEGLIQKADFWNLPSRDGNVGLDGSEWIVEGATDKYHVVSRWTPSSGPIREIGEKFLSLTGWQYEPTEFY